MTLLVTRGLVSGYGDFRALFGIDFEVGPGETVAIIGANGAGKTTFLRAIVGLNPSESSMVAFENTDIGGLPAPVIARLGIAMVPEGRRLFPRLSIQENLAIGSATGRRGLWTLEKVFGLFPVLRERRKLLPGSLSGGQQQMVAVGRALMSNAKVLLFDEISLGLAPVLVNELYQALRTIRSDGVAIVIVEQNVEQALRVSDRVYCFQEGRVTLVGRPGDLTPREIKGAYFGDRRA